MLSECVAMVLGSNEHERESQAQRREQQAKRKQTAILTETQTFQF